MGTLSRHEPDLDLIQLISSRKSAPSYLLSSPSHCLSVSDLFFVEISIENLKQPLFVSHLKVQESKTGTPNARKSLNVQTGTP